MTTNTSTLIFKTHLSTLELQALRQHAASEPRLLSAIGWRQDGSTCFNFYSANRAEITAALFRAIDSAMASSEAHALALGDLRIRCQREA